MDSKLLAADAETRAARLAVSRYGADPARVESVCQEVRFTKGPGHAGELVDAFLHEGLVTVDQAAELRELLVRTKLDPPKPADAAGADGAAADGNGTAGQDSGQAKREKLLALGDYRILRKLGEGGMGAVYLAYQESASRQVALKVLAPHLAANPALLERFEREGQLSAKLDHPNIVRGLGVGKDGDKDRHYLVMEYVDGPSAQALLEQKGRLQVGDAVHLALDIARALEYAQSRDIVHRDIQPDNILITKSGIAKLADLGLAKQTNQVSHLTATRQGFGTPYYMPYEQAINAKHADARSDIYSLGATLYHLLTGEVPFRGETLMEILERKEIGSYAPASMLNPKVPEELGRILDRMLARDPRDRYQTASELIVDLERSQLAVPVMSFVDPEAALQDPVLRSRSASPLQQTQPDLQNPRPAQVSLDPDTWYLRYYDRAGKLHRAKASTAQILQRVQEGRLNAKTLASHSPKGQYRNLSAYPTFREALRKQEQEAAASEESAEASEKGADSFLATWKWWLLVTGAVAAVLLMIGLIFSLT